MGWQLKKGTIVDYLKAMIQKAKKNLIFFFDLQAP